MRLKGIEKYRIFHLLPPKSIAAYCPMCGGSIFWKTPDTALYSTYVSTSIPPNLLLDLIKMDRPTTVDLPESDSSGYRPRLGHMSSMRVAFLPRPMEDLIPEAPLC